MVTDKKFTDELQKLANDVNFYGKRKRDTKLEAVESITQELHGEFGECPEPFEMVNWLDSNRPAKATTAKNGVSNKLAHDTVAGAAIGQTETIEDIRGTGPFLITSVQNNTTLDYDFVEALETYADHLRGSLLLSGFTYNKTGYQLDRNNDVYFDRKVSKYLIKKPVKLFDNLVFAAELDIIPTATRPTNGHVGYHGDHSLIMGHSKIEMQSLATPQGDNPKFIYTTGCCSLKNYRQQRAGQRAESSHAIAALIVERCAEAATGWQVRQLHWINGSFIDLDLEIFPDQICGAAPATAITFGDIHAEKIDQRALINAIKLSLKCEARNIFLHDLLDFESRNSHAREDHMFIAGMGDRAVKDDLDQVAVILDQIADTGADQIFVVRSNHDEQLDRWVHDPKYNFMQDAINARLYLDLQSRMYGYVEAGQKIPDLFKIALDSCGIEYPYNVEFLTRKSVVKLQGVMLSDHGDCGTNGSRGTPAQMAKTYTKSSTGHTHTAGIISGNYCSGVTGSLQMGYNERGASSWSHSHTIQYANGSRAIITY